MSMHSNEITMDRKFEFFSISFFWLACTNVQKELNCTTLGVGVGISIGGSRVDKMLKFYIKVLLK